MSTIKVNKLEQRSGCTATVGGGAGKTVTVDATTVTLGRCGGTVSLAAGATQSGFGRSGSVNWCTTAKTSPFTASSGNGYFVNTTSGSVTVTLPASPSAGDIVAIKDYGDSSQTNSITIGNNSSKINGVCGNGAINQKGQSATLVYVDGTKGWQSVQNATAALSGAIEYNVQVFAVGGGGAGNVACIYGGGGGGAGGFRCISCLSVSSLCGAVPVTIGGGSTGVAPGVTPAVYVRGSDSVYGPVTATGGGMGGADGYDACTSPTGPNYSGGSGGGAGGGNTPGCGGSGNTPPVSPSQGNPGGNGQVSAGNVRSGGGGGAGAAGQDGAPLGSNQGGNGGIGSPTSIFGSIPTAPSYGESGPNPGRYFAGGGAGRGGFPGNNGTAGSGGTGGGGDGAGNGTSNTGGGGGGNRLGPSGNGGSGIIVIKHATADASPAVSGGNVVVTCGSNTIRIFTSDGTFQA